MGTTDIAIRERIKALCKDKDYSINKLANVSDIHYSTVRDFMNGKNNNMGVLTLKKLCDGLELSLFDFFDTEAFKNLEQEIK